MNAETSTLCYSKYKCSSIVWKHYCNIHFYIIHSLTIQFKMSSNGHVWNMIGGVNKGEDYLSTFDRAMGVRLTKMVGVYCTTLHTSLFWAQHLHLQLHALSLTSAHSALCLWYSPIKANRNPRLVDLAPSGWRQTIFH